MNKGIHFWQRMPLPNLSPFRLLTILLFTCLPLNAQSRQHSAERAAPGTFDSVAARANAARDAQQLDKAVSLYQKALALRPRWVEGWWSLGTLYYDGENYASAANAFRHVVKLSPRHGTARAMLGLCEFELHQDANALDDIEASKSLGVIEDIQLRQVVFFHEGVLLQRAGRFHAAQAAFSSLCLSGIRSEELVQRFGMTMLRISEERPASLEAADAVERAGRGACLAARKDFAGARIEYEAAIGAYPHFPYLHYAFGRMLMDAKDREAAIRAFQQELAEQPTDVVSRLQIAAAEYKVDSSAGLPYASEAVRIDPHVPFAHYLLGLLLLDTGEDEKAIPHLEIARTAFPNEAKVYWSLASAYAHVGRSADAAQARAAFARVNAASGDPQPEGSSPASLQVVDGSMGTPQR